MSWLDLVLCTFFPVSLTVFPHRFYMKNTIVWVVECDKFETFLKCLALGDPTVHCIFIKNGGGLGKFMQTHFSAYNKSARPQRIEPGWYFLSRFISKVFQFKAQLLFFLVFSLYVNVEKVYERLFQCQTTGKPPSLNQTDAVFYPSKTLLAERRLRNTMRNKRL